MPRSLIVEGVAQTGGLLVCEHSRFTEKVVLAKLPKVIFDSEATPGDTLIYTAQMEYVHRDGAMVTATSHKDGQLQAEMEIVFAHLNDQRSPRSLFRPGHVQFRMMRVLRAFEVGHTADGSPLEEPKDFSKIKT